MNHKKNNVDCQFHFIFDRLLKSAKLLNYHDLILLRQAFILSLSNTLHPHIDNPLAMFIRGIIVISPF